MIRQLLSLLLIAGMVAGVLPVHATGNYQPVNAQILTSYSGTGAAATNMNNGPAFSHCAGNDCAMGQGFVWANPNGLIGPVIIDHVVLWGDQVNGAPPSGNALVAIFLAGSNGIPTGTTALASSATVSLATAFPVSATGVTYTFSGGNQIAIQPNVNYAVVIESLNTTNWGSSIGQWDGTGGVCVNAASSGTDLSVFTSGSWSSTLGCGHYQLWGDPPTVQGTVSNSTYLFSTTFSFFAILIAIGLLFRRDDPKVRKHGFKAIIVLGVIILILWLFTLIING